jgi:hypothetical protein
LGSTKYNGCLAIEHEQVAVQGGAQAGFLNDTFQDLGTGPAQIFQVRGIFVAQNSMAYARGLTIQRIAGEGVRVNGGVVELLSSTVQNNTGNGITVKLNGNAYIRKGKSTITGDGGDGIDVVSHSTLHLGDTSVTGNHGVGILVKDLSLPSSIIPRLMW